jgi:hypothetical protein
MAVGYTRTLGTNSIPVWQGTNKDIQLAQGGFFLVIGTMALGVVLPAGTPFTFDEAARTATPFATGVAYDTSGGSDVAYKILKGSALKVGDYYASGAAGGKAYAITAIDTTTSTLYDIVTVGTTIGAVTAGTLVYASTATGATASAYPTIKGLLYDDTVVGAGESVSIVIRGTIYARRVPYNATIAAALPAIIYSQSK